jgi:hypothetical protein
LVQFGCLTGCAYRDKKVVVCCAFSLRRFTTHASPPHSTLRCHTHTLTLTRNAASRSDEVRTLQPKAWEPRGSPLAGVVGGIHLSSCITALQPPTLTHFTVDERHLRCWWQQASRQAGRSRRAGRRAGRQADGAGRQAARTLPLGRITLIGAGRAMRKAWWSDGTAFGGRRHQARLQPFTAVVR